MALGNEIATSARSGAISAAKQYYKMSDNGNVWNRSIETFISAKIAEKIYRDKSLPVELEFSVKNVFDKFGLDIEKLNSSLTHLKKNRRFDVTILRLNNKKPYGVIEVKKRFTEYKLREDLNRIVEAIDIFSQKDNKSLRFGIVIVLEMIRKNQTKDADKKIGELLEKYEFPDEYGYDIQTSKKMFDLGKSKRGKIIEGMCAYSILIFK